MADAQLIREITNMYNVLAASHYSYDQWIGKLATLYGQVTGGRITREEAKAKQAEIYQIFTRLEQLNKSFGSSVNKFNKQIGPQIVAELGSAQQPTAQVKTQMLASDIIKLADAYDLSDRPNFVDGIDEFLAKMADSKNTKTFKEFILHDIFGYQTRLASIDQEQKTGLLENLVGLANYADEIGAYVLASELDKIAEEEANMPVQPPNEGNLSTRYCPDHNGVQAVRISERVYQCPIDGKVYNYETGYANYKGQKVPGGSIAAQTPSTSDYGGIPMRIYDSRQTILNRVN